MGYAMEGVRLAVVLGALLAIDYQSATSQVSSDDDSGLDSSDVIGCYRLEVGRWEPESFPEVFPHIVLLPPLVELGDEPVLRPGGSTAYSARSSGSAEAIPLGAWWREDDTVVVTTQVAIVGGVTLRVAPTANGLGGWVHAYVRESTPSPRPQLGLPVPLPLEAQAALLAVREDCGAAEPSLGALREAGLSNARESTTQPKEERR